MNIQTTTRLLQVIFMALLCAWSISPAQAATSVQHEDQKIFSLDGASLDSFGRSVAVDGNTALVGAYQDDDDGTNSGAAYVFRWNGFFWQQEAKLTPSDGFPFNSFGFSVALSGDTALVGALRGSAYVFKRNGTSWIEQAKLIAPDGFPGNAFSWSLDIYGDTIIIGAPLDDDKGYQSGSAYIFFWNGASWSFQQKLTAPDGEIGDEFGSAVALSENTALIGSHYDSELGFLAGSAHFFHRIGTSWGYQQKLTASDGAAHNAFGSAVTLDGDTAIIGAPRSDSAYAFNWNGFDWIEEAKLTTLKSSSFSFFGAALELDNELLAIGAPRDDAQGVTDSGSVYIFDRSAGSWAETTKLVASDAAYRDFLSTRANWSMSGLMFTHGVSISGQVVVAGAWLQDGAVTRSGAAYIFELQSDDQPPMVSDVLIAPNPVAYNTAFTIGALVEDGATGSSPIASASYSINGGPASAMSASDGAFDTATEQVTATVSAGLDTGVYSLCVSGEDSAGNASEPACTLLAVYDPSAGFVTGGGWIQSPLGAYSPDPNLMGKANFGFVAKYKKGANVPTGQTEFHFQAAGLNFHSDNCEWLVVAGARAQFKGTGTINGAGNYGFMISAIDEALTESSDLDLFRIKIWDKDLADQVVYDNQLGADEGSDPTTAIGGGSIVIHKPKGK
jgi:hypothetical protein